MTTQILTALKAEHTRKKTGAILWSVFRLMLLIGISYVILYPLFTKLALAFMEKGDLGDITVKWVPRHFTLDNILLVSKVLDYGPRLLKTTGICTLLAALQVASCTLSAFAFARFRFPGRQALFAIVIGTLVVPPQTYMITLFTQLQHFDVLGLIRLFTNQPGVNVLNSPWAFVLLSATGMGIRSGLYIYILRQSFRGLPKELDEAARVDGAGTWRTFAQVLLPNVMATLLVSFILAFVWQWNDTFYTSFFSPSLNTLAQTVEALDVTISSYLGGWNMVGNAYTRQLTSIGTLLCILPLLLLYIACQKIFVQGVERSGLVG